MGNWALGGRCSLVGWSGGFGRGRGLRVGGCSGRRGRRRRRGRGCGGLFVVLLGEEDG